MAYYKNSNYYNIILRVELLPKFHIQLMHFFLIVKIEQLLNFQNF